MLVNNTHYPFVFKYLFDDMEAEYNVYQRIMEDPETTAEDAIGLDPRKPIAFETEGSENYIKECEGKFKEIYEKGLWQEFISSRYWESALPPEYNIGWGLGVISSIFAG